VADDLDAPFDRFRRWIAFHEVTHAAEFAAAPWLTDHLEADLRDALEGSETLDPAALVEVNRTMTVVEGYAELLMDRAFDRDAADMRAKLDEARRGRGPLSRFLRRALGLDLKRQQYERGRAFFEAVVDAEGVAAAGRVWDDPANLPGEAELDDPAQWIARVVQ
jgi:putative hydrolase